MKNPFTILGVSGVWIIEKESGLPIACYEPVYQIPAALFGGLLTAIRTVLAEIQIGQLSSMSTDSRDIVITTSEYLVVTIILEKGFSSECVYPLLIRINELAEESYLKMMEQIQFIDMSKFSNFYKDLERIFTEHIEYMSKNCDNFNENKKLENSKDPKNKLEESGLW